jgi:SAM-dependent methyltransferase
VTTEDDSYAVNRGYWDERAPAHAGSSDYGVERFVNDPSYLSQVVSFDVPRLGDLHGLRGVHLQCHIGTDTLSLARLGARMSGVDFSEPALSAARELAAATGTEIDYLHSELYRAPEVLPAGAFDLVFTGIGALCWLPDVRRWAAVVATLLAPGGRLFIREGHPVLWAIDEQVTDALVIGYPYFETPQPLVWDEPGTYVATDAVLTSTVSHSWNHGTGEIISALLAEGLRITGYEEHDSVPWEALPGQMVRDDAGEWRLQERRERLPLSYTLQAVKP